MRKGNTSFWLHGIYTFFKRNNKRASSFYRCFSFLRLHKRGIIYTRFHTFYVHINVELYVHAFTHLYGGEKQVC